jgi:hypothetical protein
MGWSGEDDRGGSIVSDPTIVSPRANTLMCFWRNENNQLSALWWNGVWIPENLKDNIYPFVDAPSAALRSDQQQPTIVYVRPAVGADLCCITANPDVIAVSPLIDTGLSVQSEFTAANTTDRNRGVYLFYRKDDLTIAYRHSTNGLQPWSGEVVLAGSNTLERPAVVSWGDTRLDVFYRHLEDLMLMHHWTGDLVNWQGPENLGGALTSAPTASSWGAGRIDVLYRGNENGLFHRPFDGIWHNEDQRDGILSTSPAAVSWGSNRIDVIYGGENLHLWHQSWS